MSPPLDGARCLAPPGHAKRATSERGELYFWVIAPDACATYAQGSMTRNMSQLFIAQLEPLYATGAVIYGFHNWLGMESYDSACRLDLTAFMLRNRKQSVVHIAAVSRMVTMGISVANLALGGMFHVHQTEDALARAVTETMSIKPPRRTSAPPSGL